MIKFYLQRYYLTGNTPRCFSFIRLLSSDFSVLWAFLFHLDRTQRIRQRCILSFKGRGSETKWLHIN